MGTRLGSSRIVPWPLLTMNNNDHLANVPERQPAGLGTWNGWRDTAPLSSAIGARSRRRKGPVTLASSMLSTRLARSCCLALRTPPPLRLSLISSGTGADGSQDTDGRLASPSASISYRDSRGIRADGSRSGRGTVGATRNISTLPVTCNGRPPSWRLSLAGTLGSPAMDQAG